MTTASPATDRKVDIYVYTSDARVRRAGVGVHRPTRRSLGTRLPALAINIASTALCFWRPERQGLDSVDCDDLAEHIELNACPP